MMSRKVFGLIALTACFLAQSAVAETYSGELSNRIKINLGATAWKLIKSDPVGAQALNYNDAAGADIGLPNSMGEDAMFANTASGGGGGPGGPYWYRKKFKLSAAFQGKKVFLEIEGAHLGCQVYFNETLLPTASAVNPNATHVVGFIGTINDVTSLAKFDGSDNIVAIRVGNGGGFFSDPGFSTVFRFGQGTAGVFRPVWLHITDKVHVPSNVYSNLKQWGTYVATTSVAADLSSAVVRVLTNVLNENAADQTVTLTTKIVDASNNNVVASKDASHVIPAGQTWEFDQADTIANPKLWWPNNSPYGKPNMHKVYHIVKVGGVTVDVFESPLGIRTITWDRDFPYINGKKQLLYGGSSRYDYPALGTALPPGIEFRDAKLLADVGGNLWRPGHSSCSIGFVNACDAYGIMLIDPSGEGEGAFSGTAVTDTRGILKLEVHRDMIIRDRNHPSLLAWEASNANISQAMCDSLRGLSKVWDSLSPRVQNVRGTPYVAGSGDLHSCTLTGCDAQQKPLGDHINFPWWGAEYWGRASSRFGYDQQVAFSAEFLRDWAGGIKNNCFGLVQWYFAETPGEVQTFLEGGGTARSFGSSMTDFNRIPKFLYYQWGVCWVPYNIQPRIAIANHWNRSGTVRVDVWSNCPQVRLSVNNNVIGTQTPNGRLGATGGINDVSNTTTQLPYQCVFTNVAWQTGTLKAEGLDASGAVVCTDQKTTAGDPDHVVLWVDTNMQRPGNVKIPVTANGTDVALIRATVVDANGNWCPTASGIITWSVTGPATYRGGADQFVGGTGNGWHAPGDPNLNIEGGMAQVAVRSQFTTGTVTVSANVAGLPTPNASVSYTITPVLDIVRTDTVPSTGIRVVSEPVRTMPAVTLMTAGKVLRYYLNTTAVVGLDIINAQGRLVQRIPAVKQTAGWHPIGLIGTLSNRVQGSGVLLFRFTVDGAALKVKQFAVMK
jgi:beta-galactosidase